MSPVPTSDDKYKDPVKSMLDEGPEKQESKEPAKTKSKPSLSEEVKKPEQSKKPSLPELPEEKNKKDNQLVEKKETQNKKNDEVAEKKDPEEKPTLAKEQKSGRPEGERNIDLSSEVGIPQSKIYSSDRSTAPDEDKDPKASRKPIGERLVERGLISRDQLEIAVKIQKDNKQSAMIGAILVEMGFITESALGEVLTESTGIERFDPKSTIIDPALIKQVPKEVAVRFKAVPILLEDKSVYVAMTDIYNVLAIDRIQRYFPKNYKMSPVHCSETDLVEIINNYYDYELSIDGVLREMEAMMGNYDDLIRISGEQDGYINPTVRLIDALLVDAIQKGASDLHFEPEGKFVRLRYRIDGKLRLVRSFHKDYWPAIAVRIKIISEMNIAETRNPQDGRITYNVLGREIAFRVATQPTVHGENIVLRVLDKHKALLRMDQLGYSEGNIKKLSKALKRPEGIIILTGPTGSGKTTTLYTMLSHVNTSDVNIMTLEDPVEYNLPMIRQSNIKEGTGMNFVDGIRSIMRQDPDIIFVGEVRDNETATMALRAAMTGHQVYTTLHTNDAIGVIPRLVDIGLKPSLMAGNIIACVAQRLARKLCDACKEKRSATEEESKILGFDSKKPPEVYQAKGCEKCNYTGYKGRIAISEVIVIDETIDELIATSATRAEITRYLEKSGFVNMADDGVDKVIKGVTDLTELVRTINLTNRL